MFNKQWTKRTRFKVCSGCLLMVLFTVAILYALKFVLKRPRTEKIISILCFGDSLTAGITDTNINHPYSSKLQEYLNIHGWTVLDESIRPIFEVHTAGIPGERAKGEMLPRLKQILQDARIKYSWVIILGGTNDLRKYEGNVSLFDIDDTISIFNSLVKLHNVAHTFGARSVAISIPDIECEVSGTCANLKKARNKINELLREFTAHNKKNVVLADLASELYLPRDQRLWGDSVHFTAQGYDKMANVIYNSMKDHV